MYGQHTRLENEILNKILSYHFFVESYTFFCIFCQARPRVSDCVFHAIPTQRHATVTVGPGDEADHNTLALQAVRTLATMAHSFKQMYSDNIFNLEEQFTPKELTAAITVELIARKIKEIKRKDTNTGELCSWWNCCEEAKSHIGKEHIWILIVEAFKILKY